MDELIIYLIGMLHGVGLIVLLRVYMRWGW